MQVGSLLLILGGLAVLVAGGEVLVRGATGLARAMGMSSLVVGLTVVAFATSAPELAVTVAAVLAGTPGLAVGNVVGSNIANVLLVLGLAALLLPLAVRSQLFRADIPVMVVLSVVTLLLALDGGFSRLDGVVLFAALVAYLVVAVTVGRRRARVEDGPRTAQVGHGTTGSAMAPDGGVVVDLLLVAGGVDLLVVGARWLVLGATDVAAVFGVSDLVIGLTVVAVGTSLPEIATSVIAAVRGERDMAVGKAVALDIPFMVAVAHARVPVAFTGFRWPAGREPCSSRTTSRMRSTYSWTPPDTTPWTPAARSCSAFVVPITVAWLGLLVAYEIGVRRGRRECALP